MHATKTLYRGRWLALTLTLVATIWSVLAQDAAPTPQDANAAPPPSAPPQRSAAELQKLAEPIALYPDPLISIVLPAAAYPVEIVQAARFVRNTSNIPKIDDQPWDENVKSVAKFPQVIAMMDSNLTWTVDLGEAFVDQQQDLMDAIQALRALAQKAGTLQTTPQQTVYVTNIVVMQTNITQVTEVTKEIVQIIPASPSVVYVPSYPLYVYYPPPTYVYNPYAPLVTFGVGVAVGAIIANNCNWYHGGVYVGHGGVAVWGGSGYNRNVNINNYNNININNSRNANINNSGNVSGGGNRPNQQPGQGNRPGQGGQAGQGGRPSQLPADANRPGQGGQANRPTQQPAQKWQPDQNRMRTSGAGGASASTLESRGWSSGQSGANAGARPSTGMPSTGNTGARPSTGNAAARPSTGNVAARPSTGNAGGAGSSGNFSRPSTGTGGGSRPSAAPTTSNSQSRSSGSSSAFSGVNSGSSAKSYSSRGSSSRSTSSYSGGSSSGGASRGGGGGGRGGGRR